MKKYLTIILIITISFCSSCKHRDPDVSLWYKKIFYYTNNSNHDIQIITWNTDLKNDSVTKNNYDIKQGETICQQSSNSIPYTDSLIVIFDTTSVTSTIYGDWESPSKSYLYDLNNYIYSYEEPDKIYKYTFTDEDFENAVSRK